MTRHTRDLCVNIGAVQKRNDYIEVPVTQQRGDGTNNTQREARSLSVLMYGDTAFPDTAQKAIVLREVIEKLDLVSSRC
jgi:hypothetical protein